MRLRDYASTKRLENSVEIAEDLVQEHVEEPSVVRRDDELSVTSDPSSNDEMDIDTLLVKHKISKNDWIVERAVVNSWDSKAFSEGGWVSTRLSQLKCFLKAKSSIFVASAARTDGPIYRTNRTKVANSGGDLLVVLPDQQVRGHNDGYDPELHELTCEWLHENKPTIGVLSGDVIDFQSLGKYRTTLEQQAALQQEIDATYSLIRDYREAAGEQCEWSMLAGNHEARLGKYLLDKAPGLHGIKRADEDDEVLAVPYLLRLDELGVEYDEREWPYGEIQIGPYLAVRHGWIAKKHSGMSGLATLEHLGYSVVVGHTHRQALTFHTRHGIDGELHTTCAVEAGTLCHIPGGLGYAVNPNWIPGFATAYVADDGTFNPGLATYVQGKLMWQAQRYSHDASGRVVVEK